MKKVLKGYYKLLEITKKQHEYIKDEDMEKLAETIEERAKLIAQLDNFDLNELITEAKEPPKAESEFEKILTKLLKLEEKNEDLLQKKKQYNIEGLGKIKLGRKRDAEYGIKPGKARVIDSKG